MTRTSDKKHGMRTLPTPDDRGENRRDYGGECGRRQLRTTPNGVADSDRIDELNSRSRS